MVGKVAVVPIVLSVAVDVAGGESVRNMSVLRGSNVRCNCDRCACRGRPRCTWGGAAAVVAVLTVIVVVPVVVVDGPLWFWRGAHEETKDEKNTIWDLSCVCRMTRADCQWCRSHRM